MNQQWGTLQWCESTVGEHRLETLVEPVTSWRNGITFTVLTAFLSGTGLFHCTYTIILLSFSDACRALDRCSVLTASLDYYRIGVILWTEKEVCLCQPYSPCINYRCILLLTGYFLTLSWAIVLVYQERKPCIYINKDGNPSIISTRHVQPYVNTQEENQNNQNSSNEVEDLRGCWRGLYLRVKKKCYCQWKVLDLVVWFWFFSYLEWTKS